jgi:hypothetical protein
MASLRMHPLPQVTMPEECFDVFEGSGVGEGREWDGFGGEEWEWYLTGVPRMWW